MPDDPRITALRNALAAVDAATAQSKAALTAATGPDDIAGLTSALADLNAEHARLQAQIDALEASSFAIGDVPQIHTRRTVASVLRMAKAVKNHAAAVSKAVSTSL